MTIHQTKIADSRRSPREEVSTLVTLRLGDDEELQEAELDNVSMTGFLIWSDVTIDEGTRVVVILDADNPGEVPIELVGVVIRATEREHAHRPYGYGCNISL